MTGAACVTPIGFSLDEVASALWNGESGVRTIESFDTRWAPTSAGGEVRGFRLSDFVARRLARSLGPISQRKGAFAAAALARAIEESDVLTRHTRDRIGCVLGTSSSYLDLPDMRRVFDALRSSRDASELVFRLVEERPRASHWAEDPPRRLVEALDLRGPYRVHTEACAASALAIGHGLALVRRGVVDACLVGGYDALMNHVGLSLFANLGALTVAERPPAELIRPFDRDRDGMLIGEGAVVLVLERAENACAPLAFVHGAGSSNDAYSFTAPDPDGRGAAQALARALRDAAWSPEDVDYINAHGTATQLNDVTETRAIRHVFGDAASSVPVSSVKPFVGHLIGASGAVEALATIAALRDQRLPPTLSLCQPDAECDLDYVPRRSRTARVRRALSNSFGFGGVNAVVAFGSAA